MHTFMYQTLPIATSSASVPFPLMSCHDKLELLYAHETRIANLYFQDNFMQADSVTKSKRPDPSIPLTVSSGVRTLPLQVLEYK